MRFHFHTGYEPFFFGADKNEITYTFNEIHSGATPADFLVACMAGNLFSSNLRVGGWGLEPGTIVSLLPRSVKPDRGPTD